MAKSDNTDSGRAGRVYSASSVHKRRTAAPDRAQKQASSVIQKVQPAPRRTQRAAERAAEADEKPAAAVVAAEVSEGEGEVDLGATWEFTPVAAEQIKAEAVTQEAAASEAAEETVAAAAVASATETEVAAEQVVASRQARTAKPTPRSASANSRIQQVQTSGRDARNSAQRGVSIKGAYRPAGNLRRHSPVARTIAIVFTILLVALLAVGGLFSWDRWFHYDDAVDFQGEWYVHGTSTMITIDEKSIHMREDITYKYTIDTTEKTIEYRFGTMRGGGRYYFDNDRRQLVIVDGQGFSGFTTLLADLKRTILELLPTSGDDALRTPSGDGIIVFDRSVVQEPDYVKALTELGAQRAAKRAAQEAEASGNAEGAAAASSLADMLQDLAVADAKAAADNDEGDDSASDEEEEDEDYEDEDEYYEDDEDE